MLEELMRRRYGSYLNKDIKLVGWRIFSGVAAELFNYREEYENLTHAKIEEIIDGNSVIIDFAKPIKLNLLANDETNFAPYFTLLTAAYSLCKKNKDMHGITAVAVAAYSNSSINEVFSGKYGLNFLVNIGYVEKKLVKETKEWLEIEKKFEHKQDYTIKVRKTEKEKNAEIRESTQKFNKGIKNLEKAVKKAENDLKLAGLELSNEQRNQIDAKKMDLTAIHQAETQKINETYRIKVESLQSEITQTEQDLWKNKNYLTKYYYAITAKGEDFIASISRAHPKAFEKNQELWKFIDSKISAKNITDKQLSLLNVFSLQDREIMEKVASGVFREQLLEWNQLLEEQVTLCNIYEGEFEVREKNQMTKKNIRYAAGLGNPLSDREIAQVFLDTRSGSIYARLSGGREKFRIGTNNNLDFILMFTDYNLRTAFANGGLTEKYCMELTNAIRRGSIRLGDTPENKKNCVNIGIIGYNYIVNAFDTHNTGAVIMKNGSRIKIPKLYEDVILFLPTGFKATEVRYLK